MGKLNRNLKRQARRRISVIVGDIENYTLRRQDHDSILTLLKSPHGPWLVNKIIPNRIILEHALTGLDIHLIKK